MSEDKKELAKKMAQARAKSTAGRKPLAGAGNNRGNSLSFLGEEADGWTMSPKVILLFSVAYMGCVILLHIFGKISQLNAAEAPKEAPAPETPPPDGSQGGDL